MIAVRTAVPEDFQDFYPVACSCGLWGGQLFIEASNIFQYGPCLFSFICYYDLFLYRGAASILLLDTFSSASEHADSRLRAASRKILPGRVQNNFLFMYKDP